MYILGRQDPFQQNFYKVFTGINSSLLQMICLKVALLKYSYSVHDSHWLEEILSTNRSWATEVQVQQLQEGLAQAFHL